MEKILKIRWWNRALDRMGWHMWLPWDNPRIAEGGAVGVQYRKCLICNKHQRNKVV